MITKAVRVFEWGINVVLWLFHGYDDSGGAQNTTRIVNKTYYHAANSNIVKLTDSESNNQALADVTLAHPGLRFAMAITRVAGVIIMAFAGIITHAKKNQAELDQLEALAKQERLKRDNITRQVHEMAQQLSNETNIQAQIDAAAISEILHNPTISLYAYSIYLRFILRNYRLNRHKLTSFDTNKLAQMLQDCTRNDPGVMHAYHQFITQSDPLREQRLVDEVMRSFNTKTKRSKEARDSQKTLNVFSCIFEAFTTMTVVQGFAAVVVGIPVINLAMTIVMICLGVTLGTLKFIKEFGIEKHNRRENKKVSAAYLHQERLEQFSALYDHAAQFSERDNLLLQEYQPQHNQINEVIPAESVNKPLLVGRAIAGSFSAIGVGTVTGCFGVAMINGMAIALGYTGFLATVTAATIIPIVGATFACAYTLAKLAWNLYQAYQQENKSIAELAQQKRAQLQRASYDAELRNTRAQNSEQLLRRYVQNHLALKAHRAHETEDKQSFIRTIETMIGFKRPLSDPAYQDCYGKKIAAYEDDYAATEDDFYSYLASQMSSVKLARQLKNYMHTDQIPDPFPADDNIKINPEKQSKNFQLGRKKLDNPEEDDHVGNLKRTLFAVPDVASIAFSVVCIISISCCLAMIFTFAAAPIVAGVALAVLGGAFAINKVLEYQAGKRLHSHAQESAKLTMQDKVSHTTKQIAHVVATAEVSNANLKGASPDPLSLDSAVSSEEYSTSAESSRSSSPDEKTEQFSLSTNRNGFYHQSAGNRRDPIDPPTKTAAPITDTITVL